MEEKYKIPARVLLAITLFAMLPPSTTSAQTGTLFVEGNNVGIGISSPTSNLQIDSSTSNTNVLLIRSTDGQPVLRLFETLNTGGVLSLFDSVGNEDFRISGTGDSWFSSAGEVGIDCTDPDHDLTIGGSGSGCNTGVYSELDAGEAQFTTSSSRTIKQNIQPVQVDGVLTKITDIGVYNYDFVGGPKDRLGLMAEDFHQIFGRGSDETLSGQEVQMALWLAVQELVRVNQRLAKDNRELEQRVKDIEILLSGTR